MESLPLIMSILGSVVFNCGIFLNNNLYRAFGAKRGGITVRSPEPHGKDCRPATTVYDV